MLYTLSRVAGALIGHGPQIPARQEVLAGAGRRLERYGRVAEPAARPADAECRIQVVVGRQGTTDRGLSLVVRIGVHAGVTQAAPRPPRQRRFASQHRPRRMLS